jgi:hypothetical protein
VKKLTLALLAAFMTTTIGAMDVSVRVPALIDLFPMFNKSEALLCFGLNSGLMTSIESQTLTANEVSLAIEKAIAQHVATFPKKTEPAVIREEKCKIYQYKGLILHALFKENQETLEALRTRGLIN